MPPGSFSQAGRRRGLAASSVTRSINALEDGLGVRLLNRTTRKLSLTEAGRLYHERSRRIIAEVEDARLSVTQLEARRAAPCASTCRGVRPPARGAGAAAFLARYPALQIDLNMTDGFIDLVEEGVDLAARIGELEDSSLIARRLAPNRRVICASPDYLRALRRAAGARGPAGAQLPDLQAPGRPAPLGACAIAHGTVESRSPARSRANNADACMPPARGGLGLVILPTWMVGPDIQSGA